MRSLKRRTWLWFVAAAAAAGVLTLLMTPRDGLQCLNTACTYVKNGQPFDGRCGRKAGDDLNCYCFLANASKSVGFTDRSPAQTQRGCKE